MLKTLNTLFRGAAAAAEEDLADRNALPILEQQIRDVVAGVEAGRRALALALAQEAAEARRLSNVEAGLADLEARAVTALQAGREDLATRAAAAILAFGADRDQARDTHGRFQAEVQAMQQSYLDATRRLAALQRGRALARAGKAARRLRAVQQDGRPDAPATLAEAEATLGRLRSRQAGDAAAAAALEAVDAPVDASLGITVAAAAARLAAEGFGPKTAPSLVDVMARLKAKAGTPAALAAPQAS